MKSSAHTSDRAIDIKAGASAPVTALHRYFGITAEEVAAAARTFRH